MKIIFTFIFGYSLAVPQYYQTASNQLYQNGQNNRGKSKTEISGNNVQQTMDGLILGNGNKGKMISVANIDAGGQGQSNGQMTVLGNNNKGRMVDRGHTGDFGVWNGQQTGLVGGMNNKLSMNSVRTVGVGGTNNQVFDGTVRGVGNTLSQNAHTTMADGSISNHVFMKDIAGGNVGKTTSVQTGGQGTIKSATIVDNVKDNGLSINNVKQTGCVGGTCKVDHVAQMTGNGGTIFNNINNPGGTFFQMKNLDNAKGASIINNVKGGQKGVQVDRNGNAVINLDMGGSGKFTGSQLTSPQQTAARQATGQTFGQNKSNFGQTRTNNTQRGTK
jgi:hypothetical protein